MSHNQYFYYWYFMYMYFYFSRILNGGLDVFPLRAINRHWLIETGCVCVCVDALWAGVCCSRGEVPVAVLIVVCVSVTGLGRQVVAVMAAVLEAPLCADQISRWPCRTNNNNALIPLLSLILPSTPISRIYV